MGRGRIEIKRIENPASRQVTYSKRRNGLLKKASEITVLCDSQVSLVVFSSTGKISEYCSPSTSLVKILDRYQKATGRRLWDTKHENLSKEVERIKKENDSMRMELRHLEGKDLASLHLKELIPVEAALENGLNSVRSRQASFFQILLSFLPFFSFYLTGRTLEEENNRLNCILHQQQMDVGVNLTYVEQGHDYKESDHSSSWPSPFPLLVNVNSHKASGLLPQSLCGSSMRILDLACVNTLRRSKMDVEWRIPVDAYADGLLNVRDYLGDVRDYLDGL
ncbi:hypothetical protein ACLOJK_014019 [Asimina triloba]